MNALKSIYKYPIIKLVQSVMILMISVCVITTSLSLNVNASEVGTKTEGDSAAQLDGSVSKYNGKYYGTCTSVGGCIGQGVLVYLLERNGGGAVSGTTPKAFACNANALSSELHAQDKYNRYPEVTTWESNYASWASTVSNGGAIINGKISNTKDIQNWLKTKKQNTNGEASTNGILMVKTLWGEAVAEQFADEKYILVVEPIITIQYAQSKVLMDKNLYSEDDSFNDLINALQTIRGIPYVYEGTSLSKDLTNFIDDILTAYDMGEYNVISEQNSTKRSIVNVLSHSSIRLYKLLGTPISGTAKYLVDYYNSSELSSQVEAGWTKSDAGRTYYRNYANSYSYVPSTTKICNNAGFNLWNTATDGSPYKINSDSDIKTKSIGMLCMLAWSNGGQTTCDEPSIPSEHKAPDESTGTYTIVKNYREKVTKNGVTTMKDNGCYIKTGVASNITIEDEDTYKVVGWKISTKKATESSTISSTDWEKAVPSVVTKSGSSPETVTLSDKNSEKTLYVLLEKKNSSPTTTIKTDYIVKQSQITRNIDLDITDKGTSLLASKTFIWNYGSLEGGCDGHEGDPTYDNCSKNCPGHSSTDYCETWSVTDDSLNLFIKNSNKGTAAVKTILGEDLVQSATSTSRSGTGAGSVSLQFKYNMVVHRGDDKLTVAQWNS
jgi:hypothetical protein